MTMPAPLQEVIDVLPPPTRPLKRLVPSYIDPSLWRREDARAHLSSPAWQQVRAPILRRDAYRCVYCDHFSEAGRGLEVNHISGDGHDDRAENLETVCPLCHRVLHAGRSAAVFGSLLLFDGCAVDQTTLQRLCWHFRVGPSRLMDRPLMTLVGLDKPRPFRMDRPYLSSLVGYVVERYHLLERRQ